MRNCPYCKTGVIARRNALGLEVDSPNPERPWGGEMITLSESIVLPACGACDAVFPEESDQSALAGVVERSWTVRNRRKLGVRISADDEFSLGAAWVPCHDGKPLVIYLLGLTVRIGMYEGDRPRVIVCSLPSLAGLVNVFRRHDDGPRRDPSNMRYRWEARARSMEWRRIRRDGRIKAPQYLGLGISVYAYRSHYGPLSWHATLHVAWFRAWVGKVVRVASRPRPRRRTDLAGR